MLVNLSGPGAVINKVVKPTIIPAATGWGKPVIPAKNPIGNILNKVASTVAPTWSTVTTAPVLLGRKNPLEFTRPNSSFSTVLQRTSAPVVTPEVTKAATEAQNKLSPAGPNPTILTPSSPLSIPPPYQGGGGGGSSSSDVAPTDAPPPSGIAGFWANLTTTGKLGIVGGGLIVIFIGYKMLHKNGGRSAVAPKSEIKS